MLKSESNNREVISILNAKLQKDYSKLAKSAQKKELTENQQKLVDSFTLGEKKNDLVLGGSLAVSFIPLAIGLGEVGFGLVSLAPSLSNPPNEVAVSFFESAKNFSQNTLANGYSTMEKALPLLILPASVATISISSKIYKLIKERKEGKKFYTGAVIKLIDDILDNKEDPTLEFAAKFVKKVDMSGNDPKINLRILYCLAYYRNVLKQNRLDKVSDEDVEEAYNSIISYFKSLKNDSKTSQTFKNSRYLNILIFNHDEKERVKEILGEQPIHK